MVSSMQNKSVIIDARYVIVAYFLGVFLVFAEAAFAEPVLVGPLSNDGENQWHWLESVASRSQKSHYQGILVHSLLIPSKGLQMKTLRVDHGYINSEQRELITTQNGPLEQYYKQGSKVIQLDSDGQPRKLVSFDSAMMLDLLSKKNEWSSYYKLGYLGTDRFAERKVYKFTIKPETKDRFSYAVWLDQVSGVVLNYVILLGDRTVEQFYYTEFTLNKRPSNQLVNLYDFANSPINDFIDQSQSDSLGGNAQNTHSVQAQTAQKLVLQLPWLPKGFALSSVDERVASSRMYSDGLASFSVFTHNLPNRERHFVQYGYVQGATAMTVHALGQSRYITLVGELPQSVLAKIGEQAKMLDEGYNTSKLK